MRPPFSVFSVTLNQPAICTKEEWNGCLLAVGEYSALWWKRGENML